MGTLASVERWPMSWKQNGAVYVYKRLPCYPLGRSLLEEPAFSLWHAQESARKEHLVVAQRCYTHRFNPRLLLLALLPIAVPGPLVFSKAWHVDESEDLSSKRCELETMEAGWAEVLQEVADSEWA